MTNSSVVREAVKSAMKAYPEDTLKLRKGMKMVDSDALLHVARAVEKLKEEQFKSKLNDNFMFQKGVKAERERIAALLRADPTLSGFLSIRKQLGL